MACTSARKDRKTLLEKITISMVNLQICLLLFRVFINQNACSMLGSECVIVFRSPYEFVMHALWLAQGKPHDDDNTSACLCKYCGPEKSQLVISSLWTGKTKTKKPRRREREAPRITVRREHKGIGGAVWTELQHDSDSE